MSFGVARQNTQNTERRKIRGASG